MPGTRTGTTPLTSRAAFSRASPRHGFCIQASVSLSFSSPQGTSTIDLLFLCNIPVSSLKKSENGGFSDDMKVHAGILLSSLASPEYVSKSLLENHTCRKKVYADYQQLIPFLLDQLNRSNAPEQLVTSSRSLVESTLRPWTVFSKPRPARFLPGWSAAIDRKVNVRSKLLRSPHLEDHR